MNELDLSAERSARDAGLLWRHIAGDSTALDTLIESYREHFAAILPDEHDLAAALLTARQTIAEAEWIPAQPICRWLQSLVKSKARHHARQQRRNTGKLIGDAFVRRANQ